MKRAVGAIALVFALFACGSGGSRAVSASASAALRADVQQIRSAAANRDIAGATTKLAELRAQLATLRSRGQITDDGVQRVLAAANEVEQQLRLVSTTTTLATTTTQEHGKDKGGDGNGD